MRIAIINHGIFPSMVGGMERHTHFLATHLAKLGADVDVIIPELTEEEYAASEELKNPYRIIQCPWPDRPIWLWSNYLFSKYATEHLDKGDYDAIYCQGFNGWDFLNKHARCDRPFVLYNPHGLEMFKAVNLQQKIKLAHLRWAANAQAKNASVVVSLGGGMTNEVRRFLGIQPERIAVLPNAIDIEYIDRIATPVGSNRLSNSFIFVARLEINKGAALVCEAISRVLDARLTVVGSGPLEGGLRHRFASERIQFLGRLGDAQLFDLYCRSACLIFASLYEGMPTVVLEAMACGLPIIATDIGAVSTMVDQGNGVVIPPNSVSEIEAAVSAFLALPEDIRRQMGKISRHRVMERFAWPAVAARTLQVIEEGLVRG